MQMNTPSDIKIMSSQDRLSKSQCLFADSLDLGCESFESDFRQYFSYFTMSWTEYLVQNNSRSNKFKYDENVYAGYLNYNAKLSDKWGLTSGVRLELTDTKGELTGL
jgi:iron complex outermembrane receptor protein